MDSYTLLILLVVLAALLRVDKTPNGFAVRLKSQRLRRFLIRSPDMPPPGVEDLPDLKQELKRYRVRQASLIGLFISLLPFFLFVVAVSGIYFAVALSRGDFDGAVLFGTTLGIFLAFALAATINRRHRKMLKGTIVRLEQEQEARELAFARREDVDLPEPQLKALDSVRYRYLGLFALSAVVAGSMVLPDGLLQDPGQAFSFGFFVLALVLYYVTGLIYRFWLRRYAQEAKQVCLPALAKSYALDYLPESSMKAGEIRPHGLSNFSAEAVEGDGFSGILNGRRIGIQESSRGVLVRIKLNRRLDFHTLIVKRGSGLLLGGAPKGMQDVALVSSAFNRKYSVYTSDQTEARYVFDPAFMEQFLSLYEHFRRGEMAISFLGDELVFLVSGKQSQFEFRNASLFRAASKGSFEPMHRELALYAGIIDILNLSPDRGL